MVDIENTIEELKNMHDKLVFGAFREFGFRYDFIVRNAKDFLIIHIGEDIEQYFYMKKLLFSFVTEYDEVNNMTRFKIKFPCSKGDALEWL